MEEEYIIINKTAIQKRIEDLELLKRIHCYRGTLPNESEFQRYNKEQTTLKKVLSQSTALNPEIEKIKDNLFQKLRYWHGQEDELYDLIDEELNNHVLNLKMN